MNAAIELAETFDEMSKSIGSGSVGGYWAKLFQCPEGTPDHFVAVAALHAKLLKVIQVLATSEMSERSKGLYVQAASALQPFVTGSQMSAIEQRTISNHRQNIDVLFLAAEVYPPEASPDINPITLEVLEKEIEELVLEVRKSDIPMQLRHAIEAQLNTLLLAVRGYTVLGQEGFARVYGSAAVGLAQAGQATPATDATSASIYKKALGLCQKAGTAIVWASATLGGVHGVIESGTAIGGLIGIMPTEDSGTVTPHSD